MAGLNSKETFVKFLELAIEKYTQATALKTKRARTAFAEKHNMLTGLCRYVQICRNRPPLGYDIELVFKASLWQAIELSWKKGLLSSSVWLGPTDCSKKHFQIRLVVLQHILKEIKKLPDWETMTA
jgi:hypothetical protein